MNKIIKYAMASALCFVIGIVLLSVSWKLNGKDINNYNTANVSYETKNYVCKDSVKKIVVTDTSNDVIVAALPGIDKVTVTYYESAGKLEYEVTEANGSFTVKRKNIKGNINVGINFDAPKVKIAVPMDYYGDVEIECTSGTISVSGINGDSMEILTSSGGIKMVDITTKELTCTATSGDIILENINAENIETGVTSGSVKLSDVKAEAYKGKNTSGSVSFENVEAVKCKASTSSGTISLKGLKSEDITLEATSGSIKGTLQGEEKDFAIAVTTTSGSSNLKSKTDGKYSLTASATSGSIRLSFE